MEGTGYESQQTSKDQPVCVVTFFMLKGTITQSGACTLNHAVTTNMAAPPLTLDIAKS